jgi:hypothetical protein
MLSKSILFLLASSLLASTGSASPLESEKTSTEKVGTEEVRLAITENPAMTFATYDNRWCGSGQHDYANPDGGCYTLPGQGMQVWWFANTCRSKFLFFSFVLLVFS